MSFPKKGRNIQSRLGKAFPSVDVQAPLGSARFAAIIADALHREFGETHAAIKLVAGFTHANERAVKNWFAAKNGPGGPHLMTLMRHSEKVFETLIVLAGRQDLLTIKKLSDARATLHEMLRLLDKLLA